MKALALALCVALAATGARASDPVYDAPAPPPAVYGPLWWGDVHGWWYSDRQVQAADARIRYLEDRAAKECIAATNEANKRLLGAAPSTWLLAGAALVVGVVGGFYVAKKF